MAFFQQMALNKATTLLMLCVLILGMMNVSLANEVSNLRVMADAATFA
jgi:hypothetical protein